VEDLGDVEVDDEVSLVIVYGPGEAVPGEAEMSEGHLMRQSAGRSTYRTSSPEA
jgi:hypothetical protein